MIKNFFLIVFFLLTSFFIVACESLAWYSQASKGQLAIFFSSQDVKDVIKDENSSAELKEQLKLSRQILLFAEEKLALPVDSSFSEYVALKASYPVWNVYAAKKDSVEPWQWCYFIVGCVSYRGYFSEEAANSKAQQLRDEGLDVFVHGVAAYSTLGWFDDPLLSSFIYRDELNLARLLFHELAHKVLYISDDTLFNESFAEAVAEEGLRRWYQEKNNANSFLLYQHNSDRDQAFNAMLLETRDRLHNIFENTNLSLENKMAEKTLAYKKLADNYLIFKEKWSYSGFDRWFYTDMNNAKLATVADYYQLVPAFQNKIRQADFQDLQDFYEWAKKLSHQKKEQRSVILDELTEAQL